MRRIGLAVLLAVSLISPLRSEAQLAANVARIGYLSTNHGANPTCERPFFKDCVTSVTSKAATS